MTNVIIPSLALKYRRTGRLPTAESEKMSDESKTVGTVL
jgi:hypothetical protein